MTDTSDFENMERNGWSNPSIAKGYADGFEMATQLVAEKLADAVDVKPNVKVLDLCTGHGVVARELVTRGAKVTGLDFSEPMIPLQSLLSQMPHLFRVMRWQWGSQTKVSTP